MPRHPVLLLSILLAGAPAFGGPSPEPAPPNFVCEPPARVIVVQRGILEQRSCVLDTADGQVGHGSQHLLHDGVVVQSGEMRHGKREGVWRSYDPEGIERRTETFAADRDSDLRRVP